MIHIDNESIAKIKLSLYRRKIVYVKRPDDEKEETQNGFHSRVASSHTSKSSSQVLKSSAKIQIQKGERLSKIGGKGKKGKEDSGTNRL